jgi:7-cyano-7-deazaguanine synthase
MFDAIRQGTYEGIEFSAPFVMISKSSICSLGEKLRVPLSFTYSCYKGGSTHCGKCGTCVERREAFAESGLADPTAYIS